MRTFRYNRFHLILDLVGLIGLGLTFLFYCLGHTVRQTHEELYSLWANFATDIVSIWVGVRVIEYIIRRQEKDTSGRIRAVRTMRFLLRIIRDQIEFPRRASLDQLRKEFDWSTKMFRKHRRLFRKDEINDVNRFYELTGTLLGELSDLLQRKFDYDLDVNKKGALDEKRDLIWRSLQALDEARMKAEENILSETEEEWG